jgi:hypothetical protein
VAIRRNPTRISSSLVTCNCRYAIDDDDDDDDDDDNNNNNNNNNISLSVEEFITEVQILYKVTLNLSDVTTKFRSVTMFVNVDL